MLIQEQLPTLQYIPIPREVADQARWTLKDGFGHDLEVIMDTGPCRSCLRYSDEPEPFILMSYRPLADRNPYAEIGPIFVHANACEPYSRLDAFPETFSSRPLVLRAYDHKGFIATAEVAAAGDAPRIAAGFLSDPNIAEVHVRHISYTCYDFKIVRK